MKEKQWVEMERNSFQLSPKKMNLNLLIQEIPKINLMALMVLPLKQPFLKMNKMYLNPKLMLSVGNETISFGRFKKIDRSKIRGFQTYNCIG